MEWFNGGATRPGKQFFSRAFYIGKILAYETLTQTNILQFQIIKNYKFVFHCLYVPKDL